MIHNEFQKLIRSKQFDELYSYGISIEEQHSFLSLAYRMYLDLMLGKLKNAKEKLHLIQDMYLLSEFDLGIRDTLVAYHYFRTGGLSTAQKYLNESVHYFDNIEESDVVRGFWVQIRHVIQGGITTRSGDYEESSRQFKRSLNWALKLQFSNQIIQAHNNYGYSNLLLGNLNEACEQFKQAIHIIKETNFDEFMYYPVSNLGIYYLMKGDLIQSEKYHTEALTIARENNNDVQIASQYRDLGLLERMRGNYELSFEYLQKALQLHIQSGNDVWTSNTLIHLIELSEILAHFALANAYFGHLSSLANHSENALIMSLAKFGNALILKDRPKIKDKVVALDLLKELSTDDHLDRETRIRVMLYHSELLLTEYKMTESPEIVNEINSIIIELSKFAEENHSTLMYIEAICLGAQLKLLNKEYQKGLEMFAEAREIAEQKELKHLQDKIIERIRSFRDHIEMLESGLNSEEFRKQFLENYLSEYIHEVLFIKKNFKKDN